MSDIDFNNGFMCGIAIKGVPGATDSNKDNSCCEIKHIGSTKAIVINSDTIIGTVIVE